MLPYPESMLVDYGEEHARSHEHRRFGRTHGTGLYPQWSKDNPLHFLGHSLVRTIVTHISRHLVDREQGGPTILKLQWLLENGFFGVRYHPEMILSANTSEFSAESQSLIPTSHSIITISGHTACVSRRRGPG